MSEDQYDAIGGHWEDTSQLSIFELMQRSLPRLVGDLRGLDVLDVATGTGVYARKWAQAGARSVVGSDRSVEMVAAARAIEDDQPLGVTYHVADAVDHPALGTFDVVTAAFLLNYAYDAETMNAMARTMHDHLRPGGRLVGLLPEVDYRPDDAHLARYGFRYTPRGEVAIGTVTGITVGVQPPIEFEVVLARPEVYEAALTGAGFEAPRWYPVHVPDPAHPDPFDDLAGNPPVLLYEAIRAS